MRPAPLLLVPVAALLAAACSVSATSDTARPAGQGGVAADASQRGSFDPAPYCELTRRLEAAGQEAFADLDRRATAAQYRAAERSFILANRSLLGDLGPSAPARLADEVETFLAAMRQRGGLEDSDVSQRAATAAERRILAFEKRHC